ncbi:hypothetical protein, partial [Sinorhizobium meliloti]|uniref:hypothetical protein n=1 Tax=Rhizobium meliloti TaxID=382 RepID=UPI001AEED209
ILYNISYARCRQADEGLEQSTSSSLDHDDFRLGRPEIMNVSISELRRRMRVKDRIHFSSSALTQ